MVTVLAKYTLVDHEFYKNLADRQQLRTLDPHRINIDHEFSPSTILATTSIAKDFMIDPSAACNLDLLEPFILDIVYQHLCVGRSQVSCFDNIMKYTNVFVTPDNFSFTKEQILAFIAPTVHEQTNRIHKTRILLADHLSAQELNTIIGLGNSGISIIGEAVYVNPDRFDRTRGIEALLNVLHIDPAALEDALVPRRNRNVDIVEKLSTEISLQVTNRIISEITLTKQQPLKDQEEYLKKNTIYKCLKLIDHPVRQYPEGAVAGQVTGFVDREDVGKLGIEGYFQDMLAGKSGRKDERRDSL
jgi:cell division protein FtsI/penicillin-binding protein 2